MTEAAAEKLTCQGRLTRAAPEARIADSSLWFPAAGAVNARVGIALSVHDASAAVADVFSSFEVNAAAKKAQTLCGP